MATTDDFEIEDTFNCQGKQCNIKVHPEGIEWTCKANSRLVYFKMSSLFKANPKGHTPSNQAVCTDVFKTEFFDLEVYFNFSVYNSRFSI